jgi:hypothetical protein
MEKVKDTSEESKELASMMQAQPQVEQKTAYYKGILLANEELHTSIQERITKGYTVSKILILGFIPIKKKSILDSLDIARLKVELQEVENKSYAQKQYYEHWLGTAKSYEAKMDSVTRECNQEFDKVLEEAKNITRNLRLQEAIGNYKNDKKDQMLKNQYYLYLKQEINNSQVHGKKR